jgi:DNA repair protein RadC
MIILKDMALVVEQPGAVVTALQDWLGSLDRNDRLKEHFFVVLLDARLSVKLVDVVSVGTLNSSLVHPREVFIRAITMAASSILIAHNHPSDEHEPSEADVRVTQRLADAGKLIGIELLDHLIITRHSYYSFRERGKL